MLPRELWYSNKTCHQREIEAAQALHRSRLATIKPTSQGNTRPALDLTRPETLDLKHMKYNSKKMQAEQLRLEQIQQDNLALLKRMQAIMNVSAAAPPVEFIPGVRITRNQVPVTDTFLSTATTVPGAAKPLETFIGSKQRRDLAKIAEDNKAILMRITTKRSEFSRDKWAAERKRELELMQMITKDTTSGHLPQGTNGKSIFNASGPPRRGASGTLPSLPVSPVGSRPGRASVGEFSEFLAASGYNSTTPVRASTADDTIGRRFTPSLKPYNAPKSAQKKKKKRSPPAASDGVTAASSPSPVDFMTTEQAKSMVSQPVIGTFVREVEAAEAGDSHLLPVDIKIDEAQSEDGDGFAVGVVVVASFSASGTAVGDSGIEEQRLDLPLPQVLSIASESGMPALVAALQPLFGPGSRASFVRDLTPAVLSQLACAISRRVDVVVSGSSLAVTVCDESADHGEVPN